MAQVVRCGISLSRFTPPSRPFPALITCGVAGGLASDLLPGTVVIADSVALEDGERLACDPIWTRALAEGARRCGAEPVVGPVLTARAMVVGAARAIWAERGYVAVEMETALLAPLGAPLASVRVVLDAPSAELSDRWAHPLRATLDPRLWGEALWLARHLPPYAALAGRCVAEALRIQSTMGIPA